MKKFLSFAFIWLLLSIGIVFIVHIFMALLIGLPYAEWGIFARIIAIVLMMIVFAFTYKRVDIK